MTFYFHQAYASQAVDVAYPDLNNINLRQHNQKYAESVIQKHQIYGNAGVEQQIYTKPVLLQNTEICREEDPQQHALFYRAEDIQQHTLVYHDMTEAPQTQVSLLQHPTAHASRTCNKQCESERALQAHYAGHTGAKAHICDVCHKGFRRKNSLQDHYLIHTGDKHHVCLVCNRGFTQKSTLTRHRLIHTGKKPHVCDICNRGFGQKAALRVHYLNHTGEKNHICDICNKGFAMKSFLRSHYLVHSANREGKRRRGKGKVKKGIENGKKMSVIFEAETLQQQYRQEEEQHVEQEQHCGTLFVDNSGSYDQALINCGHQEFLENYQEAEQHVEQEQHCDTLFVDNNDSYDQALIYGGHQEFLENYQAFASYHPCLTHTYNQALNITPEGLHPLMAVDQSSLAELGL